MPSEHQVASAPDGPGLTPEPKLITAILPKGVALPTLAALKAEMNIVSFNINNARGIGGITPLAHRGIGAQSEKEVLKVVVDGEQADRAFEFIYVEGQVNAPHGGIVFMARLDRATRFSLPDLPEEE